MRAEVLADGYAATTHGTERGDYGVAIREDGRVSPPTRGRRQNRMQLFRAVQQFLDDKHTAAN